MRAKMVVSVFLSSIVEAEVDENGVLLEDGSKAREVTTMVHTPPICRDYSAVHATPESVRAEELVPNIVPTLVLAMIGAHYEEVKAKMAAALSKTGSPRLVKGRPDDGTPPTEVN